MGFDAANPSNHGSVISTKTMQVGTEGIQVSLLCSSVNQTKQVIEHFMPVVKGQDRQELLEFSPGITQASLRGNLSLGFPTNQDKKPVHSATETR